MSGGSSRALRSRNNGCFFHDLQEDCDLAYLPVMPVVFMTYHWGYGYGSCEAWWILFCCAEAVVTVSLTARAQKNELYDSD